MHSLVTLSSFRRVQREQRLLCPSNFSRFGCNLALNATAFPLGQTIPWHHLNLPSKREELGSAPQSGFDDWQKSFTVNAVGRSEQLGKKKKKKKTLMAGIQGWHPTAPPHLWRYTHAQARAAVYTSHTGWEHQKGTDAYLFNAFCLPGKGEQRWTYGAGWKPGQEKSHHIDTAVLFTNIHTVCEEKSTTSFKGV